MIYKLGGKDGQYDPALTRLPGQPKQDPPKDEWKLAANTPFFEGNPANSLWRVLEVSAQRCATEAPALASSLAM